MTPTSGDTAKEPENTPEVDVATPAKADLIAENLFPNVHRSTFRVADGLPTFIVPTEDLTAVVEYLQGQANFTLFEDITAVDWLPREPRFEVVYHFLSLAAKQGICLKVLVSGTNPQVPTITHIFKGAGWYEREVFDLFGITFVGHPDLRRIQMPTDWEGHPLRKDYPITGPRRPNLPSNQYRPEGRSNG